MTSSIKGAFQLHWKQFPAEGTFILKLRLCQHRLFVYVRQLASKNQLSLFPYILGQAAISKSVLRSVQIFERPVPAQPDRLYVLRELEGQY